MINSMFRKGLVFGIIFLFVGAGIIPSTVGIQKEKKSIQIIGSPGYIQDLIDNASDGDTIFIPSGIYYENIVINKRISLVGENKNTTIIDGNNTGIVVDVIANWVNIREFTIQNGDYGIELRSNGNTIKSNSIIYNNNYGICIWGSDFNIISGNNINSNNLTGIILVILGFGRPDPSIFNIIRGNNISNNEYGIAILSSCPNFIIKNNFIDNNRDAYFRGRLLNRWRQNYWNESRLLPKIIFGDWWRYITMINIDWFPAKEPYDI